MNPKFKIGEKVYMLRNDYKIKEYEVNSLYIEKHVNRYNLYFQGDFSHCEDECKIFESKIKCFLSEFERVNKNVKELISQLAEGDLPC
jgi:hypothetical protein